MLDEKRIKEARANIERYLRDGMIKKIKDKNEKILETFIRNSDESLILAENILRNNLSNLWAIVCSYYSMYYIANAILYIRGYKIGKEISHQITNEALIFFIKENLERQILEEYQEVREEAEELAKIESNEMIENFEKEKEKRAKFQYETTEIVKGVKQKLLLTELKNLYLK
ncbi:hypothetical protein FJZ17_03900 [Candidatus Pacearchaeota archaeon]|nr:hypothetical protein [Candidatus Pacearchaeota archaeon]